MPLQPEYYVLKSILNGKDSGFESLHVLENGIIHRLDFQEAIENNINKWNIKIQPNSGRRITNIENLLLEYYSQDPLMTATEAIGNFHRFDKIHLVPGKYHKRIYRPQFILDLQQLLLTPYNEIETIKRELRNFKIFRPIDYEVALDGMTQLSVIVEGLKSICRTIYPSTENLSAYGNEIRDLLILTCTEVEAQLVGIYSANSNAIPLRPNTNDYVKLKPILKLNDYSVKFSLYPKLNSYSPFSEWIESDPTESLPWYKAYNKVKHNREQEFRNASLNNLLTSVSALVVLMAAQFGKELPYKSELIGDYFAFEKIPAWETDDCYLPPFENEMWTVINALQ
jgi:hypothetical protein